MRNSKRLLTLALPAAVVLVTGAEARITRIEIQRTEPAFNGRVFGATGAYERVIGKAYGGVDPQLPANAIIQDIGLAPRNAKGRVEYVTDIDILRPADRSKGNGILFSTSTIGATRVALGSSTPISRPTSPRSTTLPTPVTASCSDKATP